MSVPSFESAQPFSFEIDGKPYILPAMSVANAKLIKGLVDASGGDESEAFDDYIKKNSDERTFTAINSLSAPNQAALVKQWMGLTPGESSASQE